MFDALAGELAAAPTQRLSTADLARVVGDLARLDERVEDTERIDQIRLLEELKAAAGAAQAQVTAAFVASQRAAQADAGVAPKNVGKGIAAQVALAKRESPARAARYVGWASIVVAELPATFSAWQDGRITKWRAQLVARETCWLTRGDRALVDTALAPRLQHLGDRQVDAEAKRLAYRLDPHGYLGRIANAEADRRVTLRPAPDTMTVLTGLLPVTSGIAVHASLRAHADALRSGGDTRSRGQIMADTLVERITGQHTATAVPIEINLVMTDTTLLNATHANSQSPSRHRRAQRHRGGSGRAGADRRIRTHPSRTRPPARASRGKPRGQATQESRGVAASALYQPDHRAAGRDGLHPSTLPTGTPQVLDPA